MRAIKKKRSVQAQMHCTPSARSRKMPTNIEVWDDPQWRPALDALEGHAGKAYTGESDPAPLAALLKSGQPVPDAVAQRLGVLLDPPWRSDGPKLSLKLPSEKRCGARAAVREARKMIPLCSEIEGERSKTGKLEAAIKAVGDRNQFSRSYLMKAWSYRDGGKGWQEVMRKLARFNPIISPRETDET